jgi:hypothetical protein
VAFDRRALGGETQDALKSTEPASSDAITSSASKGSYNDVDLHIADRFPFVFAESVGVQVDQVKPPRKA